VLLSIQIHLILPLDVLCFVFLLAEVSLRVCMLCLLRKGAHNLTTHESQQNEA